MTSDAITARNRANAQKSTGPRSAAGKAATAQNARRHGATSRPDPASVATWLRIILDAPRLPPEDLIRDDTQTRRALALAEAEVAVVAAGAALRAFENGDAEPSELTLELLEFADLIYEDQQAGLSKKDFRDAMRTYKLLRRIVRDDTEPGGRQHRLLKRYLREARGRRKKAFSAWLDHVDPRSDALQQAA